MAQQKIKRSILCLSIFCMTLSLFACSHQKQKAPEPQVVDVMLGKFQPYDVHYDTTGDISTEYQPSLKAYEESTVTTILVNEGDSIKKGQVLIKLDNSDALVKFRKAQSELRTADSRLKTLKQEREMKLQLYRQGVLSKLDYVKIIGEYRVAKEKLYSAQQDLAYAKRMLLRTEVISPINGRVAKIEVHVGEHLQKGDKIVTIVNNHTIVVGIPVSQTNIRHFKRGQKVILYANDSKKKVMTTLQNINPMVDGKNGLLDVRVEFYNKYNWPIGSSVNARVILYTVPKALVLPDSAVILRQNGYVIFGVKNNVAYQMPVKIIQRVANKIAVEANIKPNTQIVTFGGGYLHDKQKVKIRDNDTKEKS